MSRLNFKDALNRSLSVTKSYIDDEIINHTHDDRYYTETEIKYILEDKNAYFLKNCGVN